MATNASFRHVEAEGKPSKKVEERRCKGSVAMFKESIQLGFPSKTAIGLDQHAFKDIALLPAQALGSLGETVRQCFVKLAIPTLSLLQLLVLLGKKNGGSRTIAILHTTYRLTMRLVSAHISQWNVNFAGTWDSALKGNSALRAHVARTMGIELAHSEGQCVIHFLWDVRIC